MTVSESLKPQLSIDGSEKLIIDLSSRTEKCLLTQRIELSLRVQKVDSRNGAIEW